MKYHIIVQMLPGSRRGAFKTWEQVNRGEKLHPRMFAMFVMQVLSLTWQNLTSPSAVHRSPVAIIERIIELDFLEELQGQLAN